MKPLPNKAPEADPAYAFFLQTAVRIFKVVLRLHRSGKPGSLAGSLCGSCSMRRKRLQHPADILCQMFCGWRLHASKLALAKFGSGILQIDALTGNCIFNEHSVPTLSIAVELKEWLKDELKHQRIPIDAVSRAQLRAKLSLSEIPWKDRSKREIFFSKESAVRTATLNRCVINCESEVATGEAVYRSKLEDIEEWPPGWPAT